MSSGPFFCSIDGSWTCWLQAISDFKIIFYYYYYFASFEQNCCSSSFFATIMYLKMTLQLRCIINDAVLVYLGFQLVPVQSSSSSWAESSASFAVLQCNQASLVLAATLRLCRSLTKGWSLREEPLPQRHGAWEAELRAYFGRFHQHNKMVAAPWGTQHDLGTSALAAGTQPALLSACNTACAWAGRAWKHSQCK